VSLRRAAAAAVLSTALATTAALIPAGSATAEAPSERAAGKGCITKKEYRKVKKGMTVAKVRRVTGTNGKQVNKYALPGGKFVVGRAYKVCTSKRGAVGISFTNQTGTYRVASKAVAWR
jgi:hypothetical protein